MRLRSTQIRELLDQTDLEVEVQPVEDRRCGVLVADDEPAIRELLKSVLEQNGFSVWVAEDGLLATQLYHDHLDNIDVALLDVRMPNLDGPKTLAALQNVTPKIPCCFMSGDLGPYTSAELIALGAHTVVQKPFLVSDVVSLLRMLSKRRFHMDNLRIH
jgi:CheY-like chemotaxis protein